jgi:5-(carboxyamino)imidazole ribonucleotide mutase
MLRLICWWGGVNDVSCRTGPLRVGRSLRDLCWASRRCSRWSQGKFCADQREDRAKQEKGVRTPIIDAMPAKSQKPLVGVIMGSKNDYAVMRAAVEMLNEFGVAHEAKVVSAHRTPDRMFAYAETAADRGLRVIIAGAGGAAHLPGMVAAKTVLPVLGVPIAATALQGFDSLLSIVQMPKGIPVGTLAIGAAGAANAGLLAVQILATTDKKLQTKLAKWRTARRDEVLAQELEEEVRA